MRVARGGSCLQCLNRQGNAAHLLARPNRGNLKPVSERAGPAAPLAGAAAGIRAFPVGGGPSGSAGGGIELLSRRPSSSNFTQVRWYGTMPVAPAVIVPVLLLPFRVYP